MRAAPRCVFLASSRKRLGLQSERALEIAASAYLLRRGEVVYHGPANRLRQDVDVLHGAYLGKARAPAQPVLR